MKSAETKREDESMSNDNWNQQLTEIILPDYVTEVDSNLFCNYPNLRKVTMPESIIKIGAYAFAHCPCLSEIVIPENVQIIEEYAFANCASLTSISLPPNLTTIAKGTFSGCHNLTECRIPPSVIEIGNEAFADCTSLKQLNLPDGVKSLGIKAFFGCSDLTTVFVPKSVTTIGDACFSNCSNLRDIQILNPVIILGTDVFSNCDSPVIHCSLSSSAFYYAISEYILFMPDIITINTKDIIPTFDSRNCSGNGWFWNAEQKLLTLENYDGDAIVSGVALDLELKASSKNYISSKDSENGRAGIFVLDGDISISGPGKLTVENFRNGIHVSDSIKVQSGEITVIGKEQGICSVYGDVEVVGGTVYSVAVGDDESASGIHGRLRSGNARIFASDDRNSLDEVKQYLHQKYVCISHDEKYRPILPQNITQVVYNIGPNSEVVIGDNYGAIIGHDAVINRSNIGTNHSGEGNNNMYVDKNSIDETQLCTRIDNQNQVIGDTHEY